MNTEKFELNSELKNVLANIVSAKMGALIVLGYDKEIEEIRDGGIKVDLEYTPEKLFEFSKNDGAIILDDNMQKILYINAQLNPSTNIETSETGMRHRAAERAAKQTGKAIICISQRQGTIILYNGNKKETLNFNTPTVEYLNNQGMTIKENSVQERDQIECSSKKYKLNSGNHRFMLFKKIHFLRVINSDYLWPKDSVRCAKYIYEHPYVSIRPDRLAISQAVYSTLENKKNAVPQGFFDQIVDCFTNPDVLDSKCYEQILYFAVAANFNQKDFQLDGRSLTFGKFLQYVTLLAPVFKDELADVLPFIVNSKSKDIYACLEKIKKYSDLRLPEEELKSLIFKHIKETHSDNMKQEQNYRTR